MLEMLEKRLVELKTNFETAQANIKTLTEQLESQKSIALQLMGHFNEANHLHTEAKKMVDAVPENDSKLETPEPEQGISNDEELHEGCSEASEQGKAA